MTKENVQPIFIMPEGTQRSSGKTAQRNNIMAAKLVAETVRTTLGPKGMDKMLVDNLGDVVITNDGVTILKELSIEHPSAKMIVEVAKTQEDEVGDGTTTAVVLAGELLKKAEDLLDQQIHPTVLAKGYRLAAEKAHLILNNISETLSEKDDTMLKNIAITAMTGKGAETSKDLLADLTVKAIKEVLEKENGDLIINPTDIKIEKKVGGSINDSELVKGIILDKEKVHPSMPSRIEVAKIALINSSIEIKNTEIDAKISITDPEKMQQFLDMEENMLKEMVEKIISSGATVLLCQKGIDEVAQHYLANNGILAARRVKKSDMEKLSRATGANIITNLDDLKKSDLGNAGLVEEKAVGDEDMIYVRKCKNPKAVTLLVRGATAHVIDEVKRALEDAIGDLSAALTNQKIVAGAGAPEMEVARNLRHYANTLSGREQLAVSAFADAVEVIPRTLAENAGMDPIDSIAKLKAAHDKGEKWAGLNVFTGKVMDSWKAGIIEPLKIKTQAISSASEVANMILRIDDVILSGKGDDGMPGSEQGMPPMM